MKSAIIIVIALSFSLTSLGQNLPDCTNLTVEELSIDTSGAWAVTISNSCSDCASGLGGQVYCELMVVRTIEPFDTIAASNCYCHWSPNNNSESTYLITPVIFAIPPINTIRVSFNYCFCENIPFGSGLGINENSIIKDYSIFPNPSSSKTTIQTITALKNASLTIYNSMGQQVFILQNISGDNFTLDLSNLSNGLYFIEVAQDQRAIIKEELLIEN